MTRLTEDTARVLRCVSDDYENIPHTAEVLVEDYPEFSEDRVEECLRELESMEYVQVYTYDDKQSKYVVSGFTTDPDELWFYITEDGQAALKESWNPAWNDD